MADELPLAIVDLDGVVADVRHRLHHVQGRRKDWAAFFAAASDDPAHPEGLAVVETLARDHEVVFLTGRPSHLHEDTVRWLELHGLGGRRVVMRPNGDRRPAAVAKLDMLAAVAAGRTVGIVVDDDAAVLEAVRRAGHPTFAADWEARDAAAEQAITAAQELDGRT
jgi:phosphoglycolate phosphatase-like HAD superfamily hydrolase